MKKACSSSLCLLRGLLRGLCNQFLWRKSHRAHWIDPSSTRWTIEIPNNFEIIILFCSIFCYSDWYADPRSDELNSIILLIHWQTGSNQSIALKIENNILDICWQFSFLYIFVNHLTSFRSVPFEFNFNFTPLCLILVSSSGHSDNIEFLQLQVHLILIQIDALISESRLCSPLHSALSFLSSFRRQT